MKRSVGALGALLLSCCAAFASGQWLPTGQTITPTAPPGAQFQPLTIDLPTVGHVTAGQPVTTVLTPDGKQLLVLTSGFNQWRDADGTILRAASTEHLFVYDLSSGAAVFQQALDVPNAFGGLVLAADGETAYVSGGSDDTVLTFERDDKGSWAPAGKPWKLSHTSGNAVVKLSAILKPAVAGLALTANGQFLVAANYQNDSITVISAKKSDDDERPGAELDLRPGKIDPKDKGVPGGEFPYWVAVKGNETAYVSSVRDREVDVVTLGDKPKLLARLKVKGNPTRILLSKDQLRLYVAEDNADKVDVFDTVTNRMLSSVAVMPAAPQAKHAHALPGASPNALALSPDGNTLYVTDGGINAVSAITLIGKPSLLGLMPTAWQPNSVTVSADGKFLYVANGKSVAGPNPRNCMKVSKPTEVCPAGLQAGGGNQYVLALTTGGLQTVPVPSAVTLKMLSDQVMQNNGIGRQLSDQDRVVMAMLRKNIKHVIYIVKENRSFDQILGDLPGVNGDPSLVQFDSTITPNFHAMASQFVALDSFYDSGEVSGDGWAWSTSARTTDAVEKQIPVNYADRGMTYDEEGTSRGVNVSLPVSQRKAANPVADDDDNLLPGPGNETAPDGPDGEYQQGYIWNAALRAHLTIRNYGFFLDIDRYFPQVPASDRIALERNPASLALRVAYPANADLARYTDPYFRGFDNAFPDYWRIKEWSREFDAYCVNGQLPQFETVRLMHDHTGDFALAIDGVNTPETQIADNDYAVGLLVEKVANSPYAGNTLIFVIEDDAQDGPDHVDAHRSLAYVIGPYVKHNAVVSEHYTTVSMIRTMELILGLAPLNVHDSTILPMTAVFDPSVTKWTYQAQVPPMLRSTKLPLPGDGGPVVKPAHDAAYWAQKMKGFDFTAEDKLDTVAYNRILWEGTKGNATYPEKRPGTDMRKPSAN